LISMSKNAQSFLTLRMRDLKTGETMGRKASGEAADIRVVAAVDIKVAEVADLAVIEVVVEVEATEEVEEVMRMEILSGEVAEEATIMAMEVEEGDPEEDMEETTEMTLTEMMAPTGAEVVILMVELAEEPTSQEAAEVAEVATDILHEGNL
jgi:hypothetical protein